MRISTALILGMLLFQQVLHASSSIRTPESNAYCAQIMAELKERRKKYPVPTLASEPSIEYLGFIPGKYEHHRYLYQLTGDSWFSLYAPYPNAPYGDLRSIILVLGEDSAKKFDIEMLNSMQIAIASPKGFTASIKKFNQSASSAETKIPIIFYSAKKDIVDNLEYLYQYSFKSALPSSKNPKIFPHDASYHYGTILIPNIYIEHSQRQIQLIYKFIKFIQRKPELAKKDWINIFLKTLTRNLANNLDASTGNFFHSFPRSLLPVTNPLHNIPLATNLHKNIKTLVFDGRSPLEALEYWQILSLQKAPPSSQEEVESFLHAYKEFVRMYSDHPEYTKELSQEMISKDEVMKLTYEKIRALQQY